MPQHKLTWHGRDDQDPLDAVWNVIKYIFSGEGAKDVDIPSDFLLQVRGNDSHNTRAVQVDLRGASLNTNDVFILRSGGHSFIWCGKGSTGDEREMAKKICAIVAKGDLEVIYEGIVSNSKDKSEQLQF